MFLAYSIGILTVFQEGERPLPAGEIASKISEPKSRDCALSSLPQLTSRFYGFGVSSLRICCLPALCLGFWVWVSVSEELGLSGHEFKI